tara:strand:+ start:1224 stop:1856 length:633 start_codon:yes stop_codon:yes gene_type:complete
MSFANIRKPYRPKTGDAKFTFNGICSDETTLEITKADRSKVKLPHTDFQKVIDKVCKEKWGKTPGNLQLYVYNRADKEVGPRGAKMDSDGEFYDGYEADTMFFAAATKEADAPEGIMVVNQKREPMPASKGRPVNGDYCTLIMNVFAFEYEGKKGLSASLEGVQYLRKGEPFGAAKIDKDAFDDELDELDEDELEDDDAAAGDAVEDDIF